MAVNTTLATSGACILKAGVNVNPLFTGTSAHPNWEILILQAESYVNAIGRKNWTDDYATLNEDVKYILEDITSNISAMYAINYDMSGYTSRQEAQTMLDVLWARIQVNVKQLKEQEDVTFIETA